MEKPNTTFGIFADRSLFPTERTMFWIQREIILVGPRWGDVAGNMHCCEFHKKNALKGGSTFLV